MSTLDSPRVESVAIPARPSVVGRVLDYADLTKPRIAVLVLFTVAIGYYLGSDGHWQPATLIHALIGIALVAAGSSALNQYYERDTDARMNRTANRPLPSGRLQPAEVLAFGIGAGVFGCLYLLTTVNPLTAALAATTLLLYTIAYTPLKRTTSLCTAVGAIAGALPPVLGWSAAGNGLGQEAFILFGILFLWQFPHFLAIAWLYQDDYARAGLKMLPTRKPAGRIVGLMCVAYALALLPMSLLPGHVGLAGHAYSLAATVLGIGYLLCAVRFLIHESKRTARGVIYASLLYLPLLLMLLTWNHFQLLR